MSGTSREAKLATTAPDRRVRRTRQALRQALLGLIVEKGYDAVTVQDIIDRADVVRSTFYAHFTDKQDLLRSGIHELQTQLRQTHAAPTGQPARLFSFSLELFQHLHAQRVLFRALVAEGSGTLVLRWFGQMIADLIREDLSAALPQGRTTRIPPDVTVQFIAGAYMSLATWWLDTGTGHTPEQMHDMFCQLAAPAARATLQSAEPAPDGP